jgi:hypothetical protein
MPLLPGAQPVYALGPPRAQAAGPAPAHGYIVSWNGLSCCLTPMKPGPALVPVYNCTDYVCRGI